VGQSDRFFIVSLVYIPLQQPFSAAVLPPADIIVLPDNRNPYVWTDRPLWNQGLYTAVEDWPCESWRQAGRIFV